LSNSVVNFLCLCKEQKPQGGSIPGRRGEECGHKLPMR
jgi:hypothetical protein